MQIGLGIGLTLGGRPAPRVTYYVNSATGSDSNDGLTSATPFATLAKLASVMTSNKSAVLAGGSRWRESLDFTLLSGVSVRWDGASTPPIIDAFNVHNSGWTNDATLTNLWYKDIAHNSSGTNRMTVLQDGELMARKTTAALANGTTGAYYTADCSTGSPIRVYINPGSNPNSNGKTYEVCTRQICIAVGDGCSLFGLVARGAISNNGPLQVGFRALVSRCVAAFGTKHNSLIASGLMEDVVYYDNDAPSANELASIQTVAFTADATGLSVTWRRNLFYLKHDGTAAVYAHTLNDPTTTHASLTVDQCIANFATGSAGTAFGGGGLTYTVTKSCAYGNCNAFISTFTANLLSVDYSYGVNAADAPCKGFGDSTWTQVGIYRPLNSGSYPLIENPSGKTFTISHATLVSLGSFFGNALNWASGTTGALSLSDSVVIANNALTVPSSGTYGTSDRNTFARPSGGIGPFATYRGTSRNLSTAIATWRTDTSQDANSTAITTVPLTGTVANGDFRVSGVVSGAGVTEHWDYNLRAVVAGAPQAWPTIPATFAEAVTYITDPTAWTF